MFDFYKKKMGIVLCLGLAIALIITVTKTPTNNSVVEDSSTTYNSSYEEGKMLKTEIKSIYEKEKTLKLEEIEYLIDAITRNIYLGDESKTAILEQYGIKNLSKQMDFLNESKNYLEVNYKNSKIWDYKYVYLYHSLDNVLTGIINYANACMKYGENNLPDEAIQTIKKNYEAGYNNWFLYYYATKI